MFHICLQTYMKRGVFFLSVVLSFIHPPFFLPSFFLFPFVILQTYMKRGVFFRLSFFHSSFLSFFLPFFLFSIVILQTYMKRGVFFLSVFLSFFLSFILSSFLPSFLPSFLSSYFPLWFFRPTWSAGCVTAGTSGLALWRTRCTWRLPSARSSRFTPSRPRVSLCCTDWLRSACRGASTAPTSSPTSNHIPAKPENRGKQTNKKKWKFSFFFCVENNSMSTSFGKTLVTL